MGECPLPPQHDNNIQLEESLFNDGSRPGSKGTYYDRDSQRGCSSLGGITSELTVPTPPYSANNYGPYFISKPDVIEVPSFTLQPYKPNEDN
jgi:hypothetical protein